MTLIANNNTLPFCKCGCGNKVTKSGNKYLLRHNFNGVGGGKGKTILFIIKNILKKQEK